MKSILRILVTGMLVVSCATACAEATIQERLVQFNHMPARKDLSGDDFHSAHRAQFDGRSFECRHASDYTPEDTADAASAFDAFVQYVMHGDAISDFWMDPERRSKREKLLATAVEMGSWKAEYVDAVWTIRTTRDSNAREEAGRQLEKIVMRGIPIAAYKYATFLDGAPQEQYRIHAEAIDRGSPNSMTMIGGNMIARSKKLRAVGKAMLDCALAQGEVEAYEPLGMLADMEGRWVDAYRLWGEGVNKGCQLCVGRMLIFAKIRPGYQPTEPREDFMPELVKIRKFFEKSSLYSWTELEDFRISLPSSMEFHFSDDELVRLLELQVAIRRAD